MYAARNLSGTFILRFAWKPLLFFFFYSTIITCLYEFAGFEFLALPFVPIGVMGTAVAFYVGFKNNSSYERLWEARKIWGSIVNTSRTFAVFILDYLQPSEEIGEEDLKKHKRVLIYRHIAYINALRIQLRDRKMWEAKDDAFTSIVKEKTPFHSQNLLEEIKQFLQDDEAFHLYAKTNTATQILRRQSEHMLYLFNQKCLHVYKHVEVGNMIKMLYDQQGACERIKSYPFPRQYAYFSEVFVWLLALVLPFGLLGEVIKFGHDYVWFTIPMSVLISWIFNVMEIVGDKSENPFENGVNDIPMTAICRTIEIDLREMLGETNVPERIVPIRNIIM
ncbi:bestrophin family protein [Aridibaculum aurantiacum]|uniref:bestrophin family protein n=1 Tax=Aridibaculum aurantiacum TaxID=2810307 RepID=UPI001A96800F|nr:bestrophin family ion channel [Aridibaculum aurantiacum]